LTVFVFAFLQSQASEIAFTDASAFSGRIHGGFRRFASRAYRCRNFSLPFCINNPPLVNIS
jgi:hypothetical protein